MTHTLYSVRARTVDGKHQVVIVDDNGIEHTFTASIPGMELIEALDTASAGIELGDTENTRIATDVFERILSCISSFTILDPEHAYSDRSAAEQPPAAVVDHKDIHAVRIHATQYDNGYFPSGHLSYFRQDGSLLAVEESAENDYGSVAVVDDGDLGAELKELGGNYRHDSDWTLVITRDGQSGDLSDYTA